MIDQSKPDLGETDLDSGEPLYAFLADLDGSLRTEKAAMAILTEGYKQGLVSRRELVRVGMAVLRYKISGKFFPGHQYFESRFDRYVHAAHLSQSRILLGRRCDQIREFFDAVASNPDHPLEGSAEFVQHLIRHRIHLAVVTGSVQEYAEAYLQAMGFPSECTMVYGSRHPHASGIYVKGGFESNVRAREKEHVVHCRFPQSFPNREVRYVVCVGNSPNDLPLFDAVQDGLRLKAGDDAMLTYLLMQRGYVLHTDLDEFLQDDDVKRVYCLPQDHRGHPSFSTLNDLDSDTLLHAGLALTSHPNLG